MGKVMEGLRREIELLNYHVRVEESVYQELIVALPGNVGWPLNLNLKWSQANQRWHGDGGQVDLPEAERF